MARRRTQSESTDVPPARHARSAARARESDDTGPRPTTMADVAKLAGVSITTVSLVINDRPDTGLRLETKDRVRAAIAELGYRQNLQARALARRTSETIGFVGERLGTPYASRLISGAHDVARENDSLLLILDSEDEDELVGSVAELYARRVDGIIVAAEGTRVVTLPDEISRVPAVLANCRVVGGGVPSLVPDEVAGGRAVARLLLDAGHRRVAYLAGEREAWATNRRVRGFRTELASAGVAGTAVQVMYGDYRAESGYTLCQRVMGGRERPTAIFFGNDRMALGGYFALNEIGLRVPQDVSVVGYDDQEELADSMRPALTTVRLPFYEMGRQAAQLLFRGGTKPAPRQALVECPVVLRGSVAPRARAVLSAPQAHPA